MDNFRLFSQISASEDLIIEAYPAFTGKTTIEIRVDILQEGELKGTSRFLMASRKHGAKGEPIPVLNFQEEQEIEKCLLRKQFGQLHQIDRKKNQNLALDKFPPTEAESKEIHEIFLKARKQPEKYKHMNNSFLENNILLHAEDKNIHQNAFGGLIMRNGLDLALLSALRHCQLDDFPQTVHISDVLFIAPIQINQIVNFQSSVTYVHEKSSLVNVFVGVNTISNKEGIKKETRATELHFTFFCNNKSGEVK